MQIQWQNNTTIILKGKDYRVVINPVQDQDSKPAISLKDNDLLISSHKIEYDFSSGYYINGAGEYSYQGATVRVKVAKQGEDDSLINLISLSVEGVLLGVVIGVNQELSSSELEFLGNPDILIMTINSTFGSEKSIQLINSVEPRIVVPIYETEVQLQALSSEYGVKPEPQLELNIKKSDLPFDNVEIKALEPQIK